MVKKTRMKQRKSKKCKRLLVVLVLISLVAIGLGSGYLLGNQEQGTVNRSKVATNKKQTQTSHKQAKSTTKESQARKAVEASSDTSGWTPGYLDFDHKGRQPLTNAEIKQEGWERYTMIDGTGWVDVWRQSQDASDDEVHYWYNHPEIWRQEYYKYHG